MSAIGSWKVTLSTPAGPQAMHLHIDTLADTFTGRIESPMGNMDVAGKAAGNKLVWDVKVSKPIPIKVTYEIVIEATH